MDRLTLNFRRYVMSKNICTLYFSATGTTKRVIDYIANEVSIILGNGCINNVDFTLPLVRQQELCFNKDDIVIVGVPVYAGRVPNVLLEFLKSIKGNEALAAAVVLYGNRNYDDALIELRDILVSGGFNVIGGAAFVGEHSFSKILAKNRPDEQDLNYAKKFANGFAEKIQEGKINGTVAVKGISPYRFYYKPKDKNGNPVDIRRVLPKTNDYCIKCMTCAENCPMGSIDKSDPSKLNGICIKCGACIKKCPKGAKYFDDERYLQHKHELEEGLTYRREPELFL